jgi:hypothetical protein
MLFIMTPGGDDVIWREPIDRVLSRQEKAILLHEALTLAFSDGHLTTQLGEVELDNLLNKLENSEHIPKEVGECWAHTARVCDIVSAYYGG